MQSQSTILQDDRLALKATLIALTATLIIPLLVHQLPLNGSVPVGARLLPMFYAPFVAVVFFRPHTGVIAGLLAPVINHLVTGFPAWPIAGILSTELAVFTLIASFLVRMEYLRWLAAPLAYLFTKIVSIGLLALLPQWIPGQSPVDFALTSIRNGWMGILVLLIISLIAGWVRFRNRLPQ